MKKTVIIIILSLFTFAAIGYGLLNLINARSFQFFGGLVNKVDTDEKVVALTFDDGPTEQTGKILRILEEAGIKATFFVNGNHIEQHFEEAKKIVESGHELGNHTYSHQRMIFKSPSFIEEEIEKTDELIRQAGYTGDIHFRPPNGKKLLFLPYYLSKHNRKTIMWNMEPDSYPELAADSEKIIAYVTENIEPGSIILLHVMFDNEKRESLESIKGIVSALKEKGYSFKTVSELITMDGS